jgi:hypothetical protein
MNAERCGAELGAIAFQFIAHRSAFII